MAYQNNFTWDFQWTYTKIIHSSLNIMPCRNLIRNIGHGVEDATHTAGEDDRYINMKLHEIKFPLSHPQFVVIDRKFNYQNFKYAHRLDQLKLIPNSAEAIRSLNENGFKVVVVSNQAGVARGYYQEKDVDVFNRAMEEELKEIGAYIDAIYYCPHHPEAGIGAYKIDCNCRKPKPGMLFKAAHELDIDLKNSFVVGDKQSDIIAGSTAGCMTIMVLTGHGKSQLLKNSIKPDFIAADLYTAVKNNIMKYELQSGK